MPREQDSLFLDIGLEKGLLTRGQAAELSETSAKLREMGLSRTYAQLAREKNVLTPEQISDVRAEMAKRGVLPRLGGYELITKLGEGGMGAVYKARQLSVDRIVALKVMRPEVGLDHRYVKRFIREARLAARISHPNAVHVYDVGEEAGRHYISMEYVDGSDLGVEIAQGPMAEKRALEIIRGVAAALAVAHDEGIVHRDIKPTNILLDKRGEPKLLDLGIAKQIGITSHTMTRTGEALGTPSYMSPEQCRAERDIDGRSDIYSLGATLFHMMCRRPPFKARSAPAVMHMQVYDPLPDPRNFNPSVSAGMASLIRRMMGKARSERFQSCAELEKAIKHLEQGRTEAVPATARAADDTGTAPMLSANSLTGVEPDREPAFLRPARARRSWAPVAAIAALVAGVAMIGAAVVMLSRRPSATESAGSSAEPSTAKESTPVPAAEEAGGPRSGWTAESARVLAATAGGDRRKEITYYTNSIGMKLVRIPAGEFVMGSESGYADEKPAHRVRIGNAFFMGAHEVTNAQWKAFISANVRYEVKGDKESGYGSHFSRAGWNADDQPMCHVNWHHAQGFCEWLSGREGVNYRLPSEAEWEYACRAGSSTKYYWGDSMRDECAWYSNNSDGRPHSVGGKRPNEFGLYDMIGNVPEWGQSVKKAYPYRRDDGREYLSALGLRAVRGGSYDYYPSLCRSANRNWYNPDKADTAIGFRVVCLSKP